MTVAHLTGLQSLVSALLKNPEVSKYHIGGFQKLSQRRGRHCIVSLAIACWPPEAALAQLLEDDR
eukprot:12954329-Alexandrium_andersonii.AAC.1